ncbi:uncharacterized protein LOC111372000 [Olea europaea subsp. europaea]|uniref:Uncharacterized protein LOC111372000 n=1 Tax=Olea europaea subsp. europaea TaxID=158383 RepID=A0A8S0RUA8_OLEEU|nr:uncharacterized protein LOC111372000 [Olea europaea subsp. europaea]
MDREQDEIQFMGFFGIFKESYNIVTSWRKIFSQITLALILPLSFIYLAHIQISELLFADIVHNEYMLDITPQGTSSYNTISSILSSELTAYTLFKIGYLIFFTILALLSTSAVVYTIACIYTAKEISFGKIMSVVPMVWKRLMVTFIWNFIIFFAYNLIAFLVLIFIFSLFLLGSYNKTVVTLTLLFIIIYLIGMVYISVIWHLASVVSVLEESYGLNAMAKSQALIKGKMGVSVGIFLVLGLCFSGIQMFFENRLVIRKGDIGLVNRVGYGSLCLFLLSILMLLGLIMQTIIYFICKSYHHENIDKSLLADHLGGYLGEYVPLKTKDLQLEQYQV